MENGNLISTFTQGTSHFLRTLIIDTSWGLWHLVRGHQTSKKNVKSSRKCRLGAEKRLQAPYNSLHVFDAWDWGRTCQISINDHKNQFLDVPLFQDDVGLVDALVSVLAYSLGCKIKDFKRLLLIITYLNTAGRGLYCSMQNCLRMCCNTIKICMYVYGVSKGCAMSWCVLLQGYLCKGNVKLWDYLGLSGRKRCRVEIWIGKYKVCVQYL